MSTNEELILKGLQICRGVAIGKPFFLNRVESKIFENDIDPSNMEQEINRYHSALSRTRQDIKRLQKQLEGESSIEGILILDAQLEMLQDPVLTIEIENEIRSLKKNAEFVLLQAIEKFQKKFDAAGDDFFIERFKDLKDLSRRVLSYLQENGNTSLNHVPPNTIVCAKELTATDVAEATTSHVSAFVTECGGSTSHAAIVAKSKGIPYISGIPLQKIKNHPHDLIIIDGSAGLVIINPTEGSLKNYELLNQKLLKQRKSLEKIAKYPSETYDGYEVRLSSNLGMTHEIDLIHQYNAYGVGLFRSEYIFLPKNEIPSEEEQYRIYSLLVKKMKQLPVVIRTFDLGGDKTVENANLPPEKNPFLEGGRATRFLLNEKDLLKTQLRAIYRSSAYGPVSILFPMITTLQELREAKQLAEEARIEAKVMHHLPVGCTIEVPSAALVIDHFVKECDFISIGTNDLSHYSLAIDREDHTQNESIDPSLIRLIKMIITEANQEKIPVTICGEIASDPRFTALLLGLGAQELSVSPRCLPYIKNAIRNTSIVDAVHLAEKALTLKTADEVLNFLVQEYHESEG